MQRIEHKTPNNVAVHVPKTQTHTHIQSYNSHNITTTKKNIIIVFYDFLVFIYASDLLHTAVNLLLNLEDEG